MFPQHREFCTHQLKPMFYCKIFAVLRNSKLCNCLCLQSECQQLICDILRATPDAASADAAVQTARLASKAAPDAAKYALTLLYHHHTYID
jgi:hypothetical protein